MKAKSSNLPPSPLQQKQCRPFARMYVHLPTYVSEWLRTKYMPFNENLAPIRLPWMVHSAGQIVYTSLRSNPDMRRLTPICYTAQMFGLEADAIPPEMRELFPKDDARREFTAIALPAPHYYQGRWIDDTDIWQLDASDATLFSSVLVEELWNDIDHYWRDYQEQYRINHPNNVPVYYDCLLDFCDLFHISVDSVDAMYRALKRRNKKLRDLQNANETA